MNILKSLIYFSLFDHPLTEDEIFRFSSISTKNKLQEDINTLVNSGVIKRFDNFLLYKNNSYQVTKRLNGSKNAKNVMPKVKKVAAFIAKFPFVEGVAISGSLSKGYYDAESDFDFFIITQAKRVWLTRVLIALYKRIFLKNSYKEFCVNYFVSTETLEIEEKNRFTATEIVTIIPLYGMSIFKRFYDKNKWVLNYFPNYNLQSSLKQLKEIKKHKRRFIFEGLLNNFIGKAMNYLCMRIVTRRWKYKYKTSTNNPYKSKKEISKHHPDNFQEQVIKKLNLQYELCEKEYGIHLSKEYA